MAWIDDLFGVYSDPATQVHHYPGGACRHFVGVVLLGTALSVTGSRDGEAVELRWVTREDLPEPLFAPDAPVRADFFNPAVTPPVLG